MIGFFPEIYTDELVFSACSRYHELAGYRSREATGRDLFNLSRAKVAIDLPCNLEAFVESFPVPDWQTIDRLIDEHTLLPFFSPFVPIERLSCLRSDMQGNGGGSVHGRLGILTSGIAGDYLRFCPLCVEDDRTRLGETYWHRLHQIPGVEVCPTHKVFLEATAVHARSRGNRDAFVTAEKAVCLSPPRPVEENKSDHRAYLRIAHDVAWLLEQGGSAAEAGTDHRDRYLGLLYERGESSYFGQVRATALIKALKAYFSEEFLGPLGCGLERSRNWVHRLIHSNSKQRAQHPIQHLLMMQYLGVTAQEFFRLPAVRLPFGEGPWPCLNRANDHFGQPLIREYELTFTQKTNRTTGILRRPEGIFRCACGFAYYRVGPDESGEAHYRANGLVTTGLAWEKALAEGYRKWPLNELAKHFCATTETIEHQLVRLGLITSPGQCGEIATTLSFGYNKGKHPEGAPCLELLKAKRKLWLKAIKKNPDAGRNALRVKHSFLCNWLTKNDREWFEAHLPPRKPVIRISGHINWSERDKEIARAVREEAARIRSAPGRPVWVTGTGVAKNIGKLGVVSKRGKLLPLTVKLLTEVTESVEEYAVRRLLWATNCFRAEGLYPTVWELQLRAGLSNKIYKRPVVKAAVEKAMESFT